MKIKIQLIASESRSISSAKTDQDQGLPLNLIIRNTFYM